MDVRLSDGIGEIDAAAWDALVPSDDPFVRHGFLALLEDSGSAATRSGWQPLHLTLRDGDDLAGAVPLYAKSHSWGEYVFDHGWAEALERAGGSYYPKLQAAVPFTPVPGPRLLAPSSAAGEALARALVGLPERLGLSSLHVTFCTEPEALQLARAGALVRQGLQYHWQNRGYRDFQDFLDGLRSAKKKMIRKERQAVRDIGIEVEVLTGADLDARTLANFYPFYLATVDKRWGNAYLTAEFFAGLAANLRHRVVLVIARRAGRTIGAALNLVGADALYGRIWGAVEEHPYLHFECCYYAAIEFAIRQGIGRVEAGAQGQHKLLRGYAPVPTWSAHVIRDRGFRRAVERFLDQERAAMNEQMAALHELLPYRRAGECG